MELNISEIENKYDAVKIEKQEGDTDAILQALKDKNLYSAWVKIKEKRKRIETDNEFGKYQKEIKLFFDEVCAIITSPGVEKTIDWIDGLDPKFPLRKNHKKWLRQFLEENYSTHNDEIKNILSIINLFNPNDSLFEATKSSTKTFIAKIIYNFDNEVRDEFDQEMPDFIMDLNKMAEEISEIKELNLKEVQDFYTLNLEEKANDKFKPKLDLQADYYFELIGKIVENKDALTTDKSKISISEIGDKIKKNIDDIFQSIEYLKSLNIRDAQNKDIEKLYNKFEQSFNFQRSNGNISETVQDRIETIWNPIIESYESINNFFKESSRESIDEFKTKMGKIKKPPQVESILAKYIKKLEKMIKGNPLESFQQIKSVDDILKTFSKKAGDIGKIEVEKIKKELNSYFQNIIDEFKIKKIEMLNNWDVEQKDICSIKDELSGMRKILRTINNANDLIQALNKEFEGLMLGYDKILEDFTKHCKEKGIDEETLSYYEDLQDQETINHNQLLDKNVISKIKTLLENGLIQLSISKNACNE